MSCALGALAGYAPKIKVQAKLVRLPCPGSPHHWLTPRGPRPLRATLLYRCPAGIEAAEQKLMHGDVISSGRRPPAPWAEDGDNPYRGFESLPLRHLFSQLVVLTPFFGCRGI
jgi:hypothetical protein